MHSGLVGGLLPCAACCVVGVRWWADVSCACVPLMVTCSGFGLPMHARLLRLFITSGLVPVGAGRPTLRKHKDQACEAEVINHHSNRKLLHWRNYQKLKHVLMSVHYVSRPYTSASCCAMRACSSSSRRRILSSQSPSPEGDACRPEGFSVTDTSTLSVLAGTSVLTRSSAPVHSWHTVSSHLSTPDSFC